MFLGEIHALLSVTLAQLGKNDQAIKACREAIKRSPRFLFPYQNLVQLYCQTGKKQEALRVVDEAGRQPDQDAAFLADLGQLYIGSQAVLGPAGKNLTPRLIKALDGAVKLKPTEPVVFAEDWRPDTKLSTNTRRPSISTFKSKSFTQEYLRFGKNWPIVIFNRAKRKERQNSSRALREKILAMCRPISF